MTLTRYAIGSLLLAVAGFATASHALAATELYRGTLNLPFEAHWGTAVLHPGIYTLTIDPGFSGPPLINIVGQGKHERVLAITSDFQTRSAHGSIKLVNVGGTYIVKRLDAAVIGKSFDFPVPKNRSGSGQETNLTVAAP